MSVRMKLGNSSENDYPDNARSHVLGPLKYSLAWGRMKRCAHFSPRLRRTGVGASCVWLWSLGVALFDEFELETARLLNRLDLVD